VRSGCENRTDGSNRRSTEKVKRKVVLFIWRENCCIFQENILRINSSRKSLQRIPPLSITREECLLKTLRLTLTSSSSSSHKYPRGDDNCKNPAFLYSIDSSPMKSIIYNGFHKTFHPICHPVNTPSIHHNSLILSVYLAYQISSPSPLPPFVYHPTRTIISSTLFLHLVTSPNPAFYLFVSTQDPPCLAF